MKPRVTDFIPSTEDKARGIASGIGPLLSVFDRHRTTVSQGRAIYGSVSAPAFVLAVHEICTIQHAAREFPLFVVRDPISPPKGDLPGANGHCGIHGLGRLLGEPRSVIRYLQSELVRIADCILPAMEDVSPDPVTGKFG
jgi:hypothetical protein